MEILDHLADVAFHEEVQVVERELDAVSGFKNLLRIPLGEIPPCSDVPDLPVRLNHVDRLARDKSADIIGGNVDQPGTGGAACPRLMRGDETPRGGE
jgi:hypothetical protein